MFFSFSWRWVLVFCRSYLLTLGVSGGAARRRPRLVRRHLGAFVGYERGEASVENYVKAGLPASIVKSVFDILERNRSLLAGKNPWAAALRQTLLKKLGFLKRQTEVAGTTPASIENAANSMRV